MSATNGSASPMPEALMSWNGRSWDTDMEHIHLR